MASLHCDVDAGPTGQHFREGALQFVKVQRAENSPPEWLSEIEPLTTLGEFHNTTQALGGTAALLLYLLSVLPSNICDIEKGRSLSLRFSMRAQARSLPAVCVAWV